MSQLSILAQKAKQSVGMDASWKESDHPRKHGQFAKKGTGGSGGISKASQLRTDSAVVKEHLEKKLAGVNPSEIRKSAKALERSVEIDDMLYSEKDKGKIKSLKEEKTRCDRDSKLILSLARKIFGSGNKRGMNQKLNDAFKEQLTKRFGSLAAGILMNNA